MQRLHFDTKLDLVMVENKPKFFTVFISCKQKYTVYDIVSPFPTNES